MIVKIYNQSGKESGEIELPNVFELPWNGDLVHQVVTSQMANQRPVVAHAKGRGEVRGGGRKPWRQKGTGRARHGSIRSPLWKGGGVTHGPTKERNFVKKINKKMAAKALATVLSAKVRDGELLILNELSVSKPKTREAAALLRNLTSVKTDIMGKRPRALVLLAEGQAELRRAFRNLPSVELEEARNLTALQALKRKYLLLPKTSLEVLERRLAVVEPRIASENVSAADFGRNQKTTAVQDRTRSRTRRTNTA